jgi:hypothetical protein
VNLIRCRVARPLLLFGRVLATGEIVRIEERTAIEWLASGHLVALDGYQPRLLDRPLSEALTER